MPSSWRAAPRKLNERLRRLPPRANFLLAVVMLLVIWRVDFLTGTQVSMSLFFLVPIGFAAWFCGGSWAYAVAILAACAWLQDDLRAAHHYTHWMIPYWNAVVRLGFFVIVAALTNLIVRLRGVNELERAAKRQAADASRLKSNMLSFVSHEFGNSLTTLKLSLTILKESEAGAIPDARRRCYEILDRVFNHLNGAVENFLNANRLETGRFEPDLRRTPIRTLVHGAISQLEPVVESKDVRLDLDFPDHPTPVLADPDALSLVMTNLIGNAFKYTPAGGSVRVKIRVENKTPAKVLVEVKDTGIGIADEDQRKLFEGFFRTDRGKGAARGFGVGLKVAHDLLQSMGAELELDSAPGKGSRFYFRLPLWTGPENGRGEQGDA